jgi:hypothetical protein
MAIRKPMRSVAAEPEQTIGAEEIFSALQRTDRACRLLIKHLRESHPDILESPEFEDVHKLARRQMRENRELLGTGPSTTA